MPQNRHALAANAYLQELCSMLQSHRRIRRPRRDWWNPPVVLPAAVGLALSATGCGGSVVSNEGAVPGAEVCDDKIDNDGDGKIDCADPDCPACSSPVYAAPTDAGSPPSEAGPKPNDGGIPPWESGGPPDVVPKEVCNDSIDNDGDGKIDCADSDCTEQCKCSSKELCFNGLDDDCDGKTDCADSECVAIACCSMSDYAAPLPPPEDCAIADDEDCDGLIDCDDPDCASVCPGDAYSAPPK